MRLCVVSPHLDDALLSCGILVQRRVAAGDAVLCLSIFTAGTGAAERAEEDRLAIAAIGAAAEHLGELDAPDRDPAYRSLRGLFFGPEDPAGTYVAHVERRVRTALAAHAIDEVYFPLAVGSHVDHRVAHAVGRRIAGPVVRFYEDRPYALWLAALAGRMRELGVDAGLPVVARGDMIAAVDDYAYLGHFLPPGEPRVELLPWFLDALERPAAPALAARGSTLAATDAELHSLYACLARYRSQMPLIYPDEPTFVRDSLRHEQARTGGRAYVERAWTLG